MVRPRFYYPGQVLATGMKLTLPEPIARHALGALRLKVDDPLCLFTGDGGEYHARLCNVGKAKSEVIIERYDPIDRISPLSITLLQLIPGFDKMDWIVQKASELGVSRIVPVVGERSSETQVHARALRRLERWRSIAAAACEQCGRNRLPTIDPPLTLDDYFNQNAAVLPELIFVADPEAATGEPTQHSTAALALIVGPEGGLSPHEQQLTYAHKAYALSLGPRILRSETAALAALVHCQGRYGDGASPK